MKIIKNLSEIELRNSASFFVEEEKLKIWIGADSLRITELANAQKKGEVCKITSFDWRYNQDGLCQFINWVDSIGGLIAALSDWPSQGLTKYEHTEKAVRVFSPFDLERIKPLTETPKKWTIKHVVRAIVNEQAKELRCTGMYSDDYAWDDACNYRKGLIAEPLEFAADLIEDPSGWWVSEDKKQIVRVCCYSFNNNSFRLAL